MKKTMVILVLALGGCMSPGRMGVDSGTLAGDAGPMTSDAASLVDGALPVDAGVDAASDVGGAMPDSGATDAATSADAPSSDCAMLYALWDGRRMILACPDPGHFDCPPDERIPACRTRIITARTCAEIAATNGGC